MTVGLLSFGSASFLESMRSSINIPGPDTWSYAFINHILQADNNWAPTDGGWTSANLTQSVDANGWVNKDTSGGGLVNTEHMGAGVRMPGTTDYTGAWILEWQGNGSVAISDNNNELTWTQDNTTSLGNTSATYTRASNTWTNVGGQNAVVVIKPSGSNGPVLIRIVQTSAGPAPYLTNLKFYRADDLPDKVLGKIFRTPFKQQYINLNPHHIRTLDASGANQTTIVRWEHRNKPSYAGYFLNTSACGQPKYSVATAPSSCQWTLDPGGVSGMPVAMQHGEQVTFRAIDPGMLACSFYMSAVSVGANAQVTVDVTQTAFTGYPLTRTITALSWAGGNATATVGIGHGLQIGSTAQLAIAGCTPSGYNQANATCTVTNATQFTYTIANPGAATVLGTAAGHGFPNGEKVVLIMSNSANNATPTGMTQMDRKVATVASATPTTFNTGINSTGFGAFTIGYCVQNLTLNVGARNPYPVVLNDGNSPALKYHGNTIAAGTYNTFTFDKNLIANTGTTGAWVMYVNAAPLHGGIPPEIVTALINELMAMNPKNPINLYITLPTMGLNSADPDYTSAQNFAVNFVDCIINPSSVVRANGYSSLDSRCKLIIEHANETWNPGNYACNFYQAWRSYLAFGVVDSNTYSSIRAVQTVQDIQAAFPRASWPNIEYVLGMWSIFGVNNTDRLNGNTNFNSVIAGGHTPLYYFDYANFAGYINNQSQVASATIQTAGSGGVNGTAVYQVNGGFGSTAATLNVTISGGVLSAVNSVANPGSYDIYPTTPAGLTYVSGTGSGLSGATVNLVQTASGLETGVASFVAANGNAVAEEAAFAAYCDGFKYVAKGGQATIDGYLSILGLLAAAVVAQGKKVIGYEGGFEPPSHTIGLAKLPCTNGLNTISAATGLANGTYIVGPGWPDRTTVTNNSGTVLTMSNAFTGATRPFSYLFYADPTAMFIAMAKGSASWATRHRTWFDGATAIAGSIAPSDFITYNQSNSNRWYHTFFEDTYTGSGTSGAENSGLDLDYIAQGNRNRGL